MEHKAYQNSYPPGTPEWRQFFANNSLSTEGANHASPVVVTSFPGAMFAKRFEQYSVEIAVLVLGDLNATSNTPAVFVYGRYFYYGKKPKLKDIAINNPKKLSVPYLEQVRVPAGDPEGKERISIHGLENVPYKKRKRVGAKLITALDILINDPRKVPNLTLSEPTFKQMALRAVEKMAATPPGRGEKRQRRASFTIKRLQECLTQKMSYRTVQRYLDRDSKLKPLLIKQYNKLRVQNS